MSKCQDKRKFRRFCQAVHAADQYMEDMALVLKPMVPYRCNKHRCFHIGHDNWMSYERIQLFTISSRQRTRPTGILGLVSLAEIHYQRHPLNFKGHGTNEHSAFISIDIMQAKIPTNEETNELALI